nr:sigma factor-like helix-turn-helix DNA-binding protein [Flavobacterium fluviale]
MKKKLYRLEKEDCYSISEIAERFKISEGSVDSHIRNIQYQPDRG